MDEIILWLSLIAAFIKDEPVYSFILDAFPLTIVATLGAMGEQLNSNRSITGRGTVAFVINSMTVSIMVNIAAREWKIPFHFQMFFALVGGAQAKAVLEIISNKFIAWVKKNVK